MDEPKISKKLSYYLLENGLKSDLSKKDDELYAKFKYTRTRKYFEDLEDSNNEFLIKPRKIKCK